MPDGARLGRRRLACPSRTSFMLSSTTLRLLLVLLTLAAAAAHALAPVVPPPEKMPPPLPPPRFIVPEASRARGRRRVTVQATLPAPQAQTHVEIVVSNP